MNEFGKMNILDELDQMICLIDQNELIIHANKEFSQKFNRSLEEIIGKHFADFFDSYLFINNLMQFKSDSNELSLELPFHFIFNRTLFHYQLSIKKLGANLLVIGTDVTQKMALEKELDLTKIKLKKSSQNAIIGEMAAGVVQEIATPITIIMNNVNQINRLIANENFRSLEVIQAKLSYIKHNALRVHKLAYNIERYAIGNLIDEPFSDVSVQDLLSKSLELCSGNLKRNEIQLISEKIDPELRLKCKYNHISQSILNLINKSKIQMAESEERWIKVSVSEGLHSVQIKFSNSTKIHPKQGPDEVDKDLNLGLINQIAMDHLGKFYTSEENERSTFVLELPKLS